MSNTDDEIDKNPILRKIRCKVIKHRMKAKVNLDLSLFESPYYHGSYHTDLKCVRCGKTGFVNLVGSGYFR
jgi:hypothetical protein